jgi:hypothetical protein
MLKLKAQVTALAGGVFNDRRDAFGFCQRDIDRFGDTRQTFVFRDLLQMATRMEIQQRQAELLAAGEFINKGIAGFFQRVLNRMTEVNQIAVVRQNLPRAELVLFAGGFEFSNGFVAERGGAPLVFGKEGNAVAPISAARMAALATAGGADVRSNIFIKNSS